MIDYNSERRRNALLYQLSLSHIRSRSEILRKITISVLLYENLTNIIAYPEKFIVETFKYIFSDRK